MLEERLERVESITRMAIGNENLNYYLKNLMESKGFSQQYVQLQSAWDWIETYITARIMIPAFLSGRRLSLCRQHFRLCEGLGQ